jgi:hypothetical protein
MCQAAQTARWARWPDQSIQARFSVLIRRTNRQLPACPSLGGQAGSSNAGTYVTILPAVPPLEQQAIPRAAIPNCTDHLSVVNTLRESGFDSACSIEGFQLFGGEFHIQTGEIILELR